MVNGLKLKLSSKCCKIITVFHEIFFFFCKFGHTEIETILCELRVQQSYNNNSDCDCEQE